MRPLASPQEAYRRVEFDARVECSDSAQLVLLCLEELTGTLRTAVHAQAIGDNLLKSRSITRALAAITALQMGVCGESGVADALRLFYESARRTMLESVLEFDGEAMLRLRADFAEIGTALRAA